MLNDSASLTRTPNRITLNEKNNQSTQGKHNYGTLCKAMMTVITVISNLLYKILHYCLYEKSNFDFILPSSNLGYPDQIAAHSANSPALHSPGHPRGVRQLLLFPTPHRTVRSRQNTVPREGDFESV